MSTTALTPRPGATVGTVAASRVGGPVVGEVRLTRRGRLVVLVLALLVLGAVGVLLSASSSADDTSAGYPTTTVVVAPGETLWDLAEVAAGDGSTRDMVATITTLNDLDSASLQVGQQLVVPRG